MLPEEASTLELSLARILVNGSVKAGTTAMQEASEVNSEEFEETIRAKSQAQNVNTSGVQAAAGLPPGGTSFHLCGRDEYGKQVLQTRCEEQQIAEKLCFYEASPKWEPDDLLLFNEAEFPLVGLNALNESELTFRSASATDSLYAASISQDSENPAAAFSNGNLMQKKEARNQQEKKRKPTSHMPQPYRPQKWHPDPLGLFKEEDFADMEQMDMPYGRGKAISHIAGVLNTRFPHSRKLHSQDPDSWWRLLGSASSSLEPEIGLSCGHGLGCGFCRPKWDLKGNWTNKPKLAEKMSGRWA